MKIIKRAIIISIIIIIILGVTFMVLFRGNSGDHGKGQIQEVQLFDYDKQEVKNITDLASAYTVTDCIQQYLNYINIGSDSYRNMKKSDISMMLYDMLSTEYIEKNNINKESAIDVIKVTNQKTVFVPINFRVLLKQKVQKYIVQGILEDIDYNYIGDMYFIVNLDVLNTTFSIEPIYNHYNSIDEIKIENKDIQIEQNDYNQFTWASTSYEEECKRYFNTYKRLFLGKSDIAYELLDKEYREKRFSSVQQYESYIKKNRQELLKVKIENYKVDSKIDYKEYICKDQYENIYVFKETAPMQYTLTLDTYTLENEKFTQAYLEANDQNKVMMNIDKWIQMLNNRDYKTAYSVLDETFRNNTFGTEEKFEQYMRKKYPLHYELTFDTFEDQSGIYVQNIILADITGEDSSSLTNAIIMKLGENQDFVMSFDVTK